ncbi:tetratricopeptide repeat protein [Myxococcota bacterium]|nr:tetratricopeptide repeat protein [Myxococcota bacterium]
MGLRSIACLLGIGVAGALAAGCGSAKRTIRIPESVVANPKSREAQRQVMPPYVVKMSDGKRVFVAEIPVAHATGTFSTSIPLDLAALESGTATPETEADREIIEAKKASGEAVPKAEPGEPAKAKSYLATLAKVQDLFKRRQHELALIELTSLERDFPDDQRILEMKGTLLWRLGRNKQARAAWERVLALDPDNTIVAQALEQLGEDGE